MCLCVSFFVRSVCVYRDCVWAYRVFSGEAIVWKFWNAHPCITNMQVCDFWYDLSRRFMLKLSVNAIYMYIWTSDSHFVYASFLFLSFHLVHLWPTLYFARSRRRALGANLAYMWYIDKDLVFIFFWPVFTDFQPVQGSQTRICDIHCACFGRIRLLEVDREDTRAQGWSFLWCILAGGSGMGKTRPTLSCSDFLPPFYFLFRNLSFKSYQGS